MANLSKTILCKTIATAVFAVLYGRIGAPWPLQGAALIALCSYASWWHAIADRREGLFRVGEVGLDILMASLPATALKPDDPWWLWAIAGISAIFFALMAWMDIRCAWNEIRQWRAVPPQS